MLTYQGMWEQAQKLSQDYTAAAKTFLQGMINVGKNNVESELGIYYTLDQTTDLTEASVFSYPLPARCIRLKSVKIVVGGRTYVLSPDNDEDLWNKMLAAYPTQTSDYAQRLLAKRKTFEIYPTPATAGNTMYLDFEAGYPDLANDNHTTGNILTATLGSTAIVGTGTAFSSAMVGRVLKITSHPQEYDIDSVTDTEHLTLKQPYEGVSIAAGSEPFIIGEVMRTPESTHIIPVYFALWMYYQGFKQSAAKGAPWKLLYEQAMQKAAETYGKRYSSKYIPPNRVLRQRVSVMNPNFYPPALT